MSEHREPVANVSEALAALRTCRSAVGLTPGALRFHPHFHARSGGLELRPDVAQPPQRDADGREDDQDDPMSHELVAEPDLRNDDCGVEEG